MKNVFSLFLIVICLSGWTWPKSPAQKQKDAAFQKAQEEANKELYELEREKEQVMYSCKTNCQEENASVEKGSDCLHYCSAWTACTVKRARGINNENTDAICERALDLQNQFCLKIGGEYYNVEGRPVCQ